MFKPADPTRRIPTYLQAYTKENMVWQLKLTGVSIVVLYVLGYIKDLHASKRYLESMTDES